MIRDCPLIIKDWFLMIRDYPLITRDWSLMIRDCYLIIRDWSLGRGHFLIIKKTVPDLQRSVLTQQRLVPGNPRPDHQRLVSDDKG